MKSHYKSLMIMLACLAMAIATNGIAEVLDESMERADLSSSEKLWAPGRRVTGTWLIDVVFPPETGVPGFKEIITFHPGGTLSESNTTLHANSANPFFNFNGSDGHGTWRYKRNRRVSFKLVKLVFDGVTNEHIGYLRVTSTVSIDNGMLIQDAADSLTELILGPDIETGIVQPFGGADAVGRRIGVAR